MEREFMEKVLNKLDVLSSDVSEMKVAVNGLKTDVDGMKANIDMHTQDIRDIKKTLELHTQDIRGIKKTLELHTQDIKGIKKTLELHTQVILDIKDTVKTNTQEITKINGYLTVKESELFNKIRALFDGYNSNYEKETNLEVRQKGIEQKVGINSIRISMLEDTSKHHTEQISNLLAK